MCFLRVDNLIDTLTLHNVKPWLVTMHCVHTNLRRVRGGDWGHGQNGLVSVLTPHMHISRQISPLISYALRTYILCALYVMDHTICITTRPPTHTDTILQLCRFVTRLQPLCKLILRMYTLHSHHLKYSVTSLLICQALWNTVEPSCKGETLNSH